MRNATKFSQRRHGSQYASMQQCRFELQEVKVLPPGPYRLSIDAFSVEEIAAKILAKTTRNGAVTNDAIAEWLTYILRRRWC